MDTIPKVGRIGSEPAPQGKRILVRYSLAFIFSSLTIASCAVADEDLTTWNKRQPVMFYGYTPAGGETLTNFPVLVVLSNSTVGAGFNYNDFLAPPYGDLRFATTSNGTAQLNFEVEKWDQAGASYVWVQVPALTDATTTVWAFWGKTANSPSCTTNGATWSNNYLGVWHMATNTASLTDSSTNRRTSTVSGTIGLIATGIVDGADDFTPTAYVTAQGGSFTNFSGAYSVSAWINADSNSAYMPIVSTYNNGTAGFILALTNAFFRRPSFWGSSWRSSGQTIPINVWAHLAYIRNGTNGAFYMNGVQVAVFTNAVALTNGTTLSIGGSTVWANYYDGRIDEVRVSGIDRGSNWVWASWLNMASNAMFNSYGAPDNGGRPVIVNSNATVQFTSATLNGYLSSTGLATDTKVFV